MKFKSFSLIALSLSILGGCMTTTKYPLTHENTGISAVKTDRSRVENQVDISRMQAYMSVLTGKTPVTDNTFIPERGSINGRNLTRIFLTNTLESLGYKVESHNYRKNGTNIIVRLMADKPTEEYIVVGAHMDSVKNAGANDDGSGSTAVLEAATVLPNLTGRKANIIFAWFDEEELGLIGSKALAKDYKNQGLKITSVHTIDMMGWDADGDRAVELARPDGILWDYYKMVNETHQLKLPLARTNTGSSDHVSFHKNGFNSVNLSEEWTYGDTTPHYHRKTDTYETINFEYLVSGTKLLIAAVGDLSLKVAAPKNIKLVPHENFPGREKTFRSEY